MSMGIYYDVYRLPEQVFQISFSWAVVQQANGIVFYQQAVAVGIFKTLKINHHNMFIDIEQT
jgi:hypothetical protein